MGAEVSHVEESVDSDRSHVDLAFGIGRYPTLCKQMVDEDAGRDRDHRFGSRYEVAESI